MLYLFGPKETDFINGDSDLIHHTYDEVVDRSKGFYLKFKIALDKDERYKDVKKEMIINAYTPDGWNQFRVFDIYNHSNYVEVVATQLHYDLNYKKVFPFVVNKTTAQTALNVFVENFKSDLPNFKFTSNITAVHSFSTDDDLERLEEGHNALEILNRIASRWGGELEVDGYNVHLTHKLGEFTNALLYEHKNISEFVDETSMSEIVTRIHAVSRFRPEREEGSSEEPEEVTIKVVVDSPLINEYAQVYEEDYTNNDARTRDQLISWARLKYSTNNIDKPARSIKVETNIIDGQEINYGDDLVLKYTKHDVDEIIRCVGYQYNPNSRQYISVTLGSNSKTLSSTITGSVHDSTKNQLSNIEKQVQIIKYASNNRNRVTTGPLAIPDPIEGDMWYYHPDGRPNDVELRIFQDGGWVTIISDMTGENVRRAITDLELEAEGLASEIEASEGRATEKVNQALQDAKVYAEAEDARIKQEVDGAIEIAEQAKQDAVDKADQALTDAKAHAIAQDTALKLVIQGEIDAVGEEASEAKQAAQNAYTNAVAEAEAKVQAKDAEYKAIFGDYDSTIEAIETDTQTAKTNAEQALADVVTSNDLAQEAKDLATTAQSDASKAKADADQAISDASGAKTQAGQAFIDAKTAISTATSAQTDAQTAIDNAATAQTDAQTALDNAQSALTTAGSADDKAGQAIAKANAIPTTINDIITDKNLVNGSYVDTKVNDATGAWSQELVRVEGKLDELEIGGRNLLPSFKNDRWSINPTMTIEDDYTISQPTTENTYIDIDVEPNTEYTYTFNTDYARSSISGYIDGIHNETIFHLINGSFVKTFNSGDNNQIRINISKYSGQTNTATTRNLKLEKGNIATDWTPAPEDLYSQEDFKLFNAQYTQDVEGMTGRLTTVENNKLDDSTFQTFKQSEYQVTADKVTSTVERVDTAEGKISTQGTAISQNATAIASKADKTVVDTLSGTVSTHGTTIEQHATAISSKASQSDLDTVKGTVTEHGTTIEQQATSIASKADKSVVDTLSGTVSTQGTAISQNATDIASKANTATVNTLTGRVDTAESNISQNATAITQRVTTTTYNTGLATKENSVLKQSAAPAHLNGRLWLDTSVTPNVLKRSTGTKWVKATPTTASEVGAYSSGQGSALAGRVTTAETNISQTSEAITSKADKSVVDTLSGTVSTHTTTLSQHATAISSKAEQTEVDTVKGTVSTHTSTLSQHANDISARLTQSQVDNLVSDKGYSTVSYVDTEISATAGAIRTEMTAVEGKIPTEIGGRNYLLNSDFSSGVESWTGEFSISEEGAILESVVGLSHLIQSTTVIPAGRYTFQIWYEVLEGHSPYLFLTGGTDSSWDDRSFMEVNEGYSYVGITIHSDSRMPGLRYAAAAPADHAEGKVLIKKVKLEKGNTPTDWSPAPEDTLKQNDFNTFKAEYEQSAQGWSAKLDQIEQADYASKTWSNQTFATPQSVTTQLTSYAKTTDLNGLVTETALANKSYITASAVNTLLNSYAKTTALNGMVTETTLANKNFITASAVNTLLTSYAKTSALNGMVTETSLANKNYATASSVTTQLQSYAKTTDLNGLATETYVGSQLSATAGTIRSEITAVENKIPTEIGGRNLIPAFTDARWDIPSYISIVDNYTISQPGVHNVYININVEPNTEYTYTFNTDYARSAISVYIDGILNTNIIPLTNGSFVRTFNSGDNDQIRINISKYSREDRTATTRNLKLEKGKVATDWSPAPEDKADQSTVTQLSNSWALTLKSGNDIKTQINASTDSIRLASKFIHLSGTSLIDNAVIKSAHIDSLNANKITGTTADFSTIRSNVLLANVISADHISGTTALYDKLFSTTSATNRLVAQGAWITDANIISLDASTITAGTISTARLDVSDLRSKILIANVITADHINGTTALYDKLFSTTSATVRLAAQDAWITNANIKDLNASKINAGTISTARLKTTEIVSQGLSGNETSITQLVIGEDAFTSSVTNLTQQKVADELEQEYKYVDSPKPYHTATTSRSVMQGTNEIITYLPLGSDGVINGSRLEVDIEYETAEGSKGNPVMSVQLGDAKSVNVTVYHSMKKAKFHLFVPQATVHGDVLKLNTSIADAGTNRWGYITRITVSTVERIQVPIEGGNTGAISSKITQLYDMINLSVLGKEGALSRISMGEEGIQIDGKLLHITARTFIDDAVIKSAMISSLDAGKITTGELNANNVKVINLDANSISGNEASFIQAMFTARNSALQISGSGITVSKSNGNRTFEVGSNGVHFYSDTGAGAYITTHNIVTWNGSSWVDTGANSTLFASELGHSIGIGYKIYSGGQYVTRDAIRLDRSGSGTPELQVNLPIKNVDYQRGMVSGENGTYFRNTQDTAGIWMGDNGKLCLITYGKLYNSTAWLN